MNPLTTPHIADACLRLNVPMRVAPAGISPVVAHVSIQGPVIPVQHGGSVDIFLEAIRSAAPGSLLVIDNQNRSDEGCIGDLIVLEAAYHQLAGMIVWGCHRDTEALVQIGFPVFSYGCCPAGPKALTLPASKNALLVASFGHFKVTAEDYVFADTDGVVFIPADCKASVMAEAQRIFNLETAQALQVKQGVSLMEQFQFEAYLEERKRIPTYSLREHLQKINKAIEV